MVEPDRSGDHHKNKRGGERDRDVKLVAGGRGRCTVFVIVLGLLVFVMLVANAARGSNVQLREASAPSSLRKGGGKEKRESEDDGRKPTTARLPSPMPLPSQSPALGEGGGLKEPTWINYVTAKFGINAKFKESVMRHAAAVKSANVFNKTYAYYEMPDFALKDPRFERHVGFLEKKNDASRRGGGYWFWKPLIVGKLLEGMKEGEVLVYGDNDRDDFVPTIRTIVEAMVRNDIGFGITHRPQAGDRAVVWSKGDMFEEFYPNVPYEELNVEKHIYANLFVVRNNAHVRTLFAAWTRCVSIWQLVSDDPSRRPSHPHFKENRHDQALLSFLLQSKGVTLHRNEGLCKRCTQPKSGAWKFYTIDRTKELLSRCMPRQQQGVQTTNIDV